MALAGTALVFEESVLLCALAWERVLGKGPEQSLLDLHWFVAGPSLPWLLSSLCVSYQLVRAEVQVRREVGTAFGNAR